MKTTLTVSTIILAVLLVGAFTWARTEQNGNRQLKVELSGLKSQLAAAKLAVQSKNDSFTMLESKLNQTVAAINSLVTERNRLEQQSATYKHELDDLKVSASDKEARQQLVSQVPTNQVWSKTGKVLLVDGEYKSLNGNRLIFKKDGEFMVFQVDDLHPAVLARFHINADEANAKQEEMTANKQKLDALRSVQIKKMEEDRLAMEAEQKRLAEEQARQQAIAERQAWEDWLKTQSVLNDTARANADVIRANAALQNVGIPAVQVNQLQQTVRY